MSENRAKVVFVAGATGYLGGHVCRQLKAAGYRVRALARDANRLGDLKDVVDEICVAEATDIHTLDGVFEGVDVLVSSIGIRGVKRRPSVWDVDLNANMNLLAKARQAGVKQMIFVSVVNAPEIRRHVEVAEARERVADALKVSGLTYTILRPTGYFNDLAEIFEMAKSTGKVSLVGDGTARVNPIHGADLAAVIAQAIDDPAWHNTEKSLGGPDTFTANEIAALAGEALGKPVKTRHWPRWLAMLLASLVFPFNPTMYVIIKFFAVQFTRDCVGEAVGNHHLRDFFAELAARENPPA